jgi:cytochrome c oxidase subunit 4
MSYRENEHSSHDDGAVHAHIAPVKLYLGVFGALIFFTVITVAVSYVHLGAANLAVAILIATIKATLVVLFFMHLKDDSRFNALLLIGSLLFGGVFLAYTLNDTDHRSRIDRQMGARVYEPTGDRAPGGWRATDGSAWNVSGPGERETFVRASELAAQRGKVVQDVPAPGEAGAESEHGGAGPSGAAH